jgi:hypothetical protein
LFDGVKASNSSVQTLTNMLMQRGSHNLENSYERLQGVRASTVEKHGPKIDAPSGKKLLGRNRDL